MSAIFALAAALSNALMLVSQHRASSSAPKGMSAWRLGLYLVRQPIWLLGGACMIGSFVFQAVALHNGQLSIVQPLLVTELVFALVLRRVWLRQPVRSAAWLSAGITCLGLGVFVAMAEPRGGRLSPTASAWLSVVVVLGAVVGACTLLGRFGPPAQRAALLGTATSVTWALEATFIKTATDNATSGGLAGLVEHWPVYALIVGGVVGTLLEQAALHVGPLAYSQPFIVTVDPFVSVALGVWLFSEYFFNAPWEIAVAATAFGVMVVGVVFLTRTSPEEVEYRLADRSGTT